MLAIYLAALDTEVERKKMAEIYEQHRYALFKCALRITKKEDMAEDAVHSTFVKVIEHKEKYFALSCTDFRRSAVIIVRNKSIDLLRAANRFADLPDGWEDDLMADEPLTEEAVIISDEYAKMRKHLSTIDLVSRQVLDMKYVLGMSYKEIAEELNITENNVNKRITRAKAKVKKLLGEEGIIHGIH